MGRIAFVFSGQGDQHPGMGLALKEKYAAAADVFARCDALRPGTSQQCFFGSPEELKETANTQSCLFAMEMAAAAALRERGLTADMAAGFSLGELSALTCAGAMTLEDGFQLVCKRGILMQEDALKHPTAMAAVLRLTAEQVQEICARHEGVYPVNYNCPGQVSVSGLEEAMPALFEDVKKAGGRSIPINVKGGFHSPFMADAGAAFKEELRCVSLSEPKFPVYSDVTAQSYPADVASVLARQICSPVLWERAILNMIADGATAFIELGPGKTLINLIARIQKGTRTFAISAYDDLDVLISEVKSC